MSDSSVIKILLEVITKLSSKVFIYSFDETGEKFTVRQGNCLILASHNCKTDLTDKKYLTIHAQLAILAKHSTVEIHSLLTDDAHGTQYPQI